MLEPHMCVERSTVNFELFDLNNTNNRPNVTDFYPSSAAHLRKAKTMFFINRTKNELNWLLFLLNA